MGCSSSKETKAPPPKATPSSTAPKKPTNATTSTGATTKDNKNTKKKEQGEAAENAAPEFIHYTMGCRPSREGDSSHEEFGFYCKPYLANLGKAVGHPLEATRFQQARKFMHNMAERDRSLPQSNCVVVTCDGMPEDDKKLYGGYMLDVLDDAFAHPVKNPTTQLLTGEDPMRISLSHLAIMQQRQLERVVLRYAKQKDDERVRKGKKPEMPPEWVQRLEEDEQYFRDLTERTTGKWTIYEPNVETILQDRAVLVKESTKIDLQKIYKWEYMGALRWTDVSRMGGYLWALAGLINHKQFPYDMVMVTEIPDEKQETQEKTVQLPPQFFIYACDSTGKFDGAKFRQEGETRFNAAIATFQANLQDYTMTVGAEQNAAMLNRRNEKGEPVPITAEELKANAKESQEKMMAYTKEHTPEIADYIFLHLTKANAK